jgi:hypothetical protein
MRRSVRPLSAGLRTTRFRSSQPTRAISRRNQLATRAFATSSHCVRLIGSSVSLAVLTTTEKFTDDDCSTNTSSWVFAVL